MLGELFASEAGVLIEHRLRPHWSQAGGIRTGKELSSRFGPCASGTASAESLCPRRVTNTGKASGTRNGQVSSMEFLS